MQSLSHPCVRVHEHAQAWRLLREAAHLAEGCVVAPLRAAVVVADCKQVVHRLLPSSHALVAHVGSHLQALPRKQQILQLLDMKSL